MVKKYKNEVMQARLFIAALLIVVKDWKSAMAIIGDWSINQGAITTECYAAGKGNENYFNIVWSGYQDISLCVKCQIKKIIKVI